MNDSVRLSERKISSMEKSLAGRLVYVGEVTGRKILLPLLIRMKIARKGLRSVSHPTCLPPSGDDLMSRSAREKT